MKILVAGGAGFIGAFLCERLIKEGHLVVCVDDFSLGTLQNLANVENNGSFKLYAQDICDLEAMSDIFAREKPDYVMHLAANSDIQASAENPQIEYKNTYSTTYSLLENMRRHGVKKLFFSSTSAVYGDKQDIKLDENTPNLEPVSYYGAAKLGAEALISAYSHMNEFSSLVFRFPNVVGPRLTHGVIFDFMARLKQDSTKLRILGDGKQTKPYLYIDDLLDGILQFMDTPQGVTLYNIGVETATSVTKIADIVCGEMGLSSVKYEYTGGVGGWKGDVPRFNYCLAKIWAAGWNAKHTSDEAVRTAVKWEINRDRNETYE